VRLRAEERTKSASLLQRLPQCLDEITRVLAEGTALPEEVNTLRRSSKSPADYVFRRSKPESARLPSYARIRASEKQCDFLKCSII
jgi:hypothetical protein